jgi:hypothetical protein
MDTQSPLAILETMMAARTAYRANLTALGYTRVIVDRYESSWTAWVHPNYIRIVEGLNAKYSNIDIENLEEAVGHPLPEDAVLPDFWLAHPSDSRPGRDVYGTNTWD